MEDGASLGLIGGGIGGMLGILLGAGLPTGPDSLGAFIANNYLPLAGASAMLPVKNQFEISINLGDR
jgi:hypothetical protein